MKKLSETVVISDVDGTLLHTDHPIPRRNIDALIRFTGKGGRFLIATGRSKELTEEYVRTLPVNAPCILYNGGGLYDFAADRFLMQDFLGEDAKRHLAAIRAGRPEVPALVIAGNNYYHVDPELKFASFSDEHLKAFENATEEQMAQPWYKVLFSVNSGNAFDFYEYVNSQNFADVRFVHTHRTLVEMLPAHSSKGYALKKLVELGVFVREQLVAIGDYYNDREMIEYAAIGAVTAEAPEELKRIADFVAGPCESGAVADLIEYLERITGE